MMKNASALFFIFLLLSHPCLGAQDEAKSQPQTETIPSGEQDDYCGWIMKTVGIGGGTIGGAGVAATGIGFTTSGIAAGSAAAAAQAGIGNVVAGSAFSVLQAVGAVGAFQVMAVAGVVAAAGAGSYCGYKYLTRDTSQQEKGKQNKPQAP